MIQSYSKYKGVKLQWFSSIPSSWNLISFKHLLQKVYGGGTPSTSIDENWGEGDDLNCVPWVAISDITKSEGVLLETSKRITEKGRLEKGLEILPKGTLLMSIFASLGKTTILGIEATVNQAILGLVPSPKLNLDFLGYLLMDAERYVNYYSSASTQENLNLTKIKNLQFPVPSIEEQTKIAQYLDHQTAIIDQLILQKEKMIELLKEKRQAVINEAVTKGLDPNAKMKDSGIEWLGEVPEHWDIKRIKNIKSNEANAFVDGPFGSNLKSEHFIENGDVYVIESGFITSGVFEQKRDFKTISYEHFQTINRSSCKEGDIIIAKIGANYGMSGILPKLEKPSVVSGNSLKLSVDTKNNVTEFIHNVLLNLKLCGSLELIVNATAQPALSLGTLNEVSIAIPPRAEQIQISHFVKGYSNQNGELVSSLVRQIEKLKEYRQSIVSEAVTGKIDVRDWQPNKQQNN